MPDPSSTLLPFQIGLPAGHTAYPLRIQMSSCLARRVLPLLRPLWTCCKSSFYFPSRVPKLPPRDTLARDLSPRQFLSCVLHRASCPLKSRHEDFFFFQLGSLKKYWACPTTGTELLEHVLRR